MLVLACTFGVLLHLRLLLLESLQLKFCVCFRVYSWGWGLFGQLGHNSIENETRPRLVSGLENQFIVTVSTGHSHSMALSSEVSIGSSESFSTPGTVIGQLPMSQVLRVKLCHALVRSADLQGQFNNSQAITKVG